MKQFKHILYYIIGIITIACCPDVEPATVATEIETLTLFNYNNATPLAPLSNEEAIAASGYSIAIVPDAPSLSEIEAKKRNGPFRSPDCDPIVDPIFVFEDKITTVAIFANDELSPEIAAGSNIIDLFTFSLIIPDNEFGIGSITVFEDNKLQRLNLNLESDTIQNGYQPEEQATFFAFNLKPSGNALDNDNFRISTTFRVELLFESGRVLTAVTPKVTLTP